MHKTEIVENSLARISYNKIGSGSMHWCCFHGFGQSSEAFQFLSQMNSSDFTFYCFDLLYHGGSSWKGGPENPVSMDEFSSTFQLFLEKENIENFSLLGFSLGSKNILPLLKNFPERILKVIFLAPQGILNKGWYHVATAYWIPRKIFQFCMAYPFLLLIGISVAERFSDNSPNHFKRLRDLLKSETGRKKIVETWMVFRKLQVNRKQLLALLAVHHVDFVFGDKDRISEKKNFAGLWMKLKSVSVTDISCSHWDFLSSFKREVGSGRLDKLFNYER